MSKQLAYGFLENHLNHMKEDLKELEVGIKELPDSCPMDYYQKQKESIEESKKNIESLEDCLKQFPYISDSTTFLSYVRDVYPEYIDDFGRFFGIAPVELKAYWEGFNAEELKKVKRKIVQNVWNNTNYFSVVSDAINHGIYNI